MITSDLDCAEVVKSTLRAAGRNPDDYFVPIGIDRPGLKDIEGLLPDRIKTAVNAANPNLISRATSNDKETKTSALNELKRLYRQEYLLNARTDGNDYDELFVVTKKINNLLVRQREAAPPIG